MDSLGQHPESQTTSSKRVEKWQKELLPLMTRMLVALTVFFFLASCVQLVYLHRTIQNGPKVDVRDSLAQLSSSPASTPEQALMATRLRALVTLEAATVEHHYHQANVLLMSRIWISYLGFVTGMILAFIGAAFILGKLEMTASELKAQLGTTGDVFFRSSSPGLLLAAFGLVLMITTLVTNHKIETKHTPVYLGDTQGTSLTVPASSVPTINIPETESKKQTTPQSK